MKKFLFGLAAILVLSTVALWQFQGDSQLAPDVSFTDLEGNTFTTQDLRGKVVLVKFWATSCTTCIAQMPGTIERYLEMKDRGFDTVAVAMHYDPPNYVLNFTQSREIPFPVVIDAQGTLAKAFGDVTLTPTTFLIDKHGKIIKRYLGNYDELAFLATVEKALAS